MSGAPSERQRVSRRDFIRLATLLGISTGLAACAQPPAAQPTAAPAAKPTEAPAKPAAPAAATAPAPAAKTAAPTGAVGIVQGVDAESLDPMVTTSSASRSMIHAMFETLVRRDAKMELQPGLALSWETPNDTTWRFKLRQGVVFHDGSPFTADVAKYSLERYVDPETKNVQAALLKPVKTITIVDPQTIDLVTDGPYAPMLDVLADVPMMSPTAVRAAGDQVARRPVGTGQYRFVEWVPGERVVMEANAGYWGEKAKLGRITWRPVAEASTRIVALRTGEADLISNVPPQMTAQLNDPSLKTEKVEGIIITVMFNAAKKPFDDTKVRQALNYAVNVDEIIQFVLGGGGTRLASTTRPGMLGHDPNLKPYTYDPEKAKQLLAEAGYPNGFEATLDSPSGRYLNDKAVSEAVAGQLNKIGLKVNVNVIEWNNFVQRVVRHESQFFLIAQVDPISELAFPRCFVEGGALYQNYKNPQVVQLIQRANSTMNREERGRLFREANQVMQQDPPWLFLYAQHDVYGVRTRLQGFQPSPNGYIYVRDMSVAA